MYDHIEDLITLVTRRMPSVSRVPAETELLSAVNELCADCNIWTEASELYLVPDWTVYPVFSSSGQLNRVLGIWREEGFEISLSGVSVKSVLLTDAPRWVYDYSDDPQGLILSSSLPGFPYPNPGEYSDAFLQNFDSTRTPGLGQPVYYRGLVVWENPEGSGEFTAWDGTPITDASSGIPYPASSEDVQANAIPARGMFFVPAFGKYLWDIPGVGIVDAKGSKDRNAPNGDRPGFVIEFHRPPPVGGETPATVVVSLRPGDSADDCPAEIVNRYSEEILALTRRNLYGYDRRYPWADPVQWQKWDMESMGVKQRLKMDAYKPLKRQSMKLRVPSFI